MLLRPLIWLLAITCCLPDFTSGLGCYHCVSYAHLLAPNLRHQLGAQTDIFHWPIDASSPSCAKPSATANSHQLHAQICTKFPLCVTLSPNLANTSFVVRGCMEQILVTRLRINERLQKEGCYLVHSRSVYPTLAPLDYIICICSTEYCNSEVQNPFVHINYSNANSNEIIDLMPAVEGVQLANELTAKVQNLATDLNLLPALIPGAFITSLLMK